MTDQLPNEKITISLLELQELWCKFMYEQTGEPHPFDYPRELTPAWPQYCRKFWGAYDKELAMRLKQLEMMGMSDTHQIDWYVGRKPILPI